MAIPVQTRFNALAPDLARGVRAAIATLVPFYFAARLGRSDLSWMALGGWLGTLADPSGSRFTRAKTLFAFALAGASTVALSEAVGDIAWLAPLGLAAIAFGASLLRALGSTTSTFGTLLTVIAAIGTTHHGRPSVRDGLLFALGAGLALVLTSIVWPVWRHFPLRKAMAKVWEAMAEYATALSASVHDDLPEGHPRWTALHRQYHRRYREALEEARSATLAERARRAGESRVGGNLRVLSGLAESEWPLLVTLSQEMESLATGTRPKEVPDELTRVVASWQSIVQVLRTPVLRASAALPPEPLEPTPLGPVIPMHTLLLSRLVRESAMALARARSLDAPLAPAERAEERPGVVREWFDSLQDDLRTLRDSFTPRSTFFRHALRVGGAALAASIVGERLSAHPQWVTITTVAILQPYAGATVSRAAHRVVGTVLGSLVAVAIIMTVHSPLALAVLMFPLSVAAVATQPRGYRLFTFFLTPVFVLLSERYQGDWWTAAARVGDALAGGAIALVAALVIFPSREIRRLPDITARMLQAVATYAHAVLRTIDRERDAGAMAAVAEARRGAGVALGEAETSLERLLAEPLQRDQDGGDALRLITYARRTTSAVTAIDTIAGATTVNRSAARNAAIAVDEWLARAFDAAAVFVRDGTTVISPPPPELPADLSDHLRAGLARIVRYADLVAGVARPAD